MEMDRLDKVGLQRLARFGENASSEIEVVHHLHLPNRKKARAAAIELQHAGLSKFIRSRSAAVAVARYRAGKRVLIAVTLTTKRGSSGSLTRILTPRSLDVRSQEVPQLI